MLSRWLGAESVLQVDEMGQQGYVFCAVLLFCDSSVVLLFFSLPAVLIFIFGAVDCFPFVLLARVWPLIYGWLRSLRYWFIYLFLEVALCRFLDLQSEHN